MFINHEGDLFRTRLTHSIEVAQIARTAASRLALNCDLTGAIALAHDLGRIRPSDTPAKQHLMNAAMRMFRGFEHNLQSLRIVDKLEEQYPAFDGLVEFDLRGNSRRHFEALQYSQCYALGRFG